MKVSVLNTVDTSHEDMIHDAQMDYYGKKLATCSSDRTVRIFEISEKNQTLVATLRGHEGPVWSVSWAHPKFGNLLASCSYDRKVILWKETSNGWTKLQEFCNHDSSVNAISWASPDYGLMLACGSSDGSVSIISSSGDGHWETIKISNAHTIGCNAVSWAPSVVPGTLLEGTGAKSGPSVKRFVTGGCDNLVKVWKEVDGQWEEEEKLEAHSDWVRDVAWAPNVGLPISTIATCSQDCRVVIWTKDEVNGGTWTSKVVKKFGDVVWHVSWSVTGSILAVSGGDNKVSLWKESLEGQWVCVSDVYKGQGQEPQ
nr:protein SEC13 homolog isoform X1 [Pocillopora verrucosa]